MNTGFIKPSELYNAQTDIIMMMAELGKGLDDLDPETQEFLKLNPVTKQKEDVPFRETNGVWVTEESFNDAERRRRPLNEHL